MEKLKRFFTILEEPTKFTRFDAIAIYTGLTYLFFNLALN